MFRIICAIGLSCLSATVAYGQSPQFCRNSFAPGEKIETRFMGINYALLMHALAEKYCGAEPAPMGPKFLGYLKRQGCGPETEIYRDVEMSISRLEGPTLKLLAQGGEPGLSLSERQAQDWAASASKELGGCERLIKLHNSEPESWQ
ncbi:hypothetical protein [Rhizobium lentis]|uniref:hypothetical protein n=1 Tax=Rhizobium lentis TaxID=1138194 RepID=UPI001C83E4C6|nr:hypothetical protein [Rhizobium lentis]MBX4997048.1 hypothetical protein [Rhizobium lentis]MBX5018575.1 hypothetical protein [Rhizobium lentis]